MCRADTILPYDKVGAQLVGHVDEMKIQNDVIFLCVVKMLEFVPHQRVMLQAKWMVFECHLLGDLFMANCIGSFGLADITNKIIPKPTD